jgi:polysaccharide biosynthesis/export protein
VSRATTLGLPDQLRIPHSALRTLLLLTAACATAPATVQDPAPTTATVSRVHPGDVVRVAVWREPDYSGDYPVDARGRLILPQLGTMVVTGRTTDWLSDSLSSAYRKLLNNPSVSVTVMMRVTVSGEVGRPGFVPADATMSVGDLISQAGGLTPYANRDKIQLLRDGRVIVASLGPGTMLQRTPVQSGDQVYVPQRGWLYRNGHYFVTGLISVASAVTVAYLVRR